MYEETNETQDVSSDPVIAVKNLSKSYTIWSSPAARLHGPLLGQIGQWPFLPVATRTFCRRVSHESFRNFYALHDVSFEVQRGESVGIIGLNGAGKSTLLQILAGTLMPTTGTLSVQGSVAALLELGSGFNSEFTGRENVYLNAAIRGLTKKETDAKFDEIVEFAGIGEFIEQPIKTYSSGMMVRLAFAVSACVVPDVLIVDEALSVGDVFFQQKCARHMQEKMKGRTKILVTHDLHAVVSFADRVYVLDRGQILFGGPPREAVEAYIKLAHNEGFRQSVAAPASMPSAGGGPLAELPWQEVKPETRSGAGQIIIERVAVTDVTGAALPVIQARDRVIVRMILACALAKDQVLVGYTIFDRLGNLICGENTCSVAAGIFQLAAGRHLVQFEFDWPEIRPGEYTMTIGVGEGTDPMNHVIQCWAHTVTKFTAISPGKVIHCLFNNPLANLKVNALDER